MCDPDAPRHAGCIWGGYTDAGAIGTWGIGAFNDVFGYNDPYYDNMWVSEDITGFTISVTVSSAFSTGKFNLTNPFAKLKQLVPSVCSGGGFGYGAVTIPVAPDVGLESIALVEYDTKGGGAHGGVLGAEFGPAVVGVESLRTWNDWQSHTGPILIGGDEFSAASRMFGKTIAPGTFDAGGFAGWMNGQLSIGGYLGGKVFGGGGYFSLSWSGCKP